MRQLNKFFLCFPPHALWIDKLIWWFYNLQSFNKYFMICLCNSVYTISPWWFSIFSSEWTLLSNTTKDSSISCCRLNQKRVHLYYAPHVCDMSRTGITLLTLCVCVCLSVCLDPRGVVGFLVHWDIPLSSESLVCGPVKEETEEYDVGCFQSVCVFLLYFQDILRLLYIFHCQH